MSAQQNQFISEEIFRNLFDKNPLPMWVFDTNTLQFLLVNKAAIKKYGYSHEEFLSMTIADIRPKEERKKLLEHHIAITESNRLSANQGIWKHKTKDGEIIFVDITSSAILFEGKQAVAVAVSDVTEKEKAKQELMESEERFRLLAESSLEGIVLSENKIIIDSNEQFVKMFGYETRSELIGKNVETLVHPKDVSVVIEKIQETNTEPYELVCIKKDGTNFIVKSKGRIIPFGERAIRISVVSDITAQKENEKNLKQSEERFRHLFENNLAGVFRSEVGGGLIEVNQALAEIFGYKSAEELKKIKAQQLYYSIHDRERYLNELQKNKYVKNFQMRMKKKDGSEIWILENVQLAKDFKTGKEFIEGTLIDITETKRVQQALQESEENYKSLIEHTPDGILIHDEKGETIFANPAALKMIGISSLQEVAEKNLFGYVLPEYHEKIRTRKEELSQGKEAPFMEIKIRKVDGKTIEVETKTSRINYHGEKAVEVVLHDISLQRQLEREQMRLQLEEESNRELKREIAAHIRTRQRLNANQKYIRLLIDSSLDMIFACDEKGKFTEFNRAAQLTFGYKPEEILGKQISILYADRGHSERIGDLIFQDGNYMGEADHLKKNGETFPAYVNASLLKNDKGEIIGTMSISRDITRIKEAEEQLKKSVHEKEILLKEIHHRVKNNMQVISSILKLQSAYVKDKKTVELLNECRNRIASMAFIHASLYMTKDFANINFSDYVSNIAGNLQQSYVSADKKILLQIDVPKVNLHIDDAIPCGLIINELLSNSFKYAFVKKKRGTVGISVKVKKENIILAIWDNGSGFPKNINYKNTESLGLQLVNSLSEQIGGKIKMESKKEVGTKFIIAFEKQKKPHE
ncbi:MAG: PAS domain S-box protein [Bacteroidetes bacterium]|nr:PAS domain S-box protein [Bacteroidota bacterium]